VFGRTTKRIKTVHRGEDRWRKDLIDWGNDEEKSGGFARRKSIKSYRPSLRKNNIEDPDFWSRGSGDRRSSTKGFQSFDVQGTEGAGTFGLASCETLK
jgi:hypothetical protein